MRIKEIEKRCNLSSKTIRFYEEKGLLDVAHSENSYREYDEDTILQLKKIKLLRKLGISIADILRWQQQELSTHDMLTNRLQELERNQNSEEIIKGICKDVLKKEATLSLPDAFLETVDFIETEEFQQFSRKIHRLSQRSLFTQILQSLIFIGPIAWLFLNIADKNLDQLMFNAVLALIAMAVLSISWLDYWKHRGEHKELKKGTLIAFIGFIFCLVSGFLTFIGIGFFQENSFAGDAYMMLAMPRIFQMLAFFFMAEAIVIVFAIIHRKKKNEDFVDFDIYFNFFKRHKWIVIALNIIILYLCVINIAVVYPDRIEVRRFYQPFPKTYQVQQIDHVETGFIGSNFNLMQGHKGDFYYRIYFKDGTSINISQPTPSHEQKYMDHTYLEIEEYDAYLMKHNIEKISSDEHYDANNLGQEYRERFLRMVKNK